MAAVIFMPHDDIPVVLRNNVVIDMANTCIRGTIWSHIMIKIFQHRFPLSMLIFKATVKKKKMAFGHAVRIKNY